MFKTILASFYEHFKLEFENVVHNQIQTVALSKVDDEKIEKYQIRFVAYICKYDCLTSQNHY